jgi:acetate---CoA ligase (ADP-forming)
MSADCNAQTVSAELSRLKGAGLFAGLRGQPPLDTAAVARVAVILADLVRAYPDLVEIEINPLVLYPDGALALDALMATI